MRHKYKVCVYAICKNEENFVDGWMDSMGEADSIVVTDTGSTDGTVAKLQARGAVVHQGQIQPWRFDKARNLSLSHVPEDANICVCTDLDERFEPGWRSALEQAWQPGIHTVNYLYNWSLKPDGSPDTQFVYFKIHTRWEYVWQYPIHECLRYTGRELERKVFAEGIVLNHYPDDSKPRSSYLPLLEMAVQEVPEDDRMSYYLGREYLYAGRWQECMDALRRYLDLPSARWPEERCAAMRWIAKSSLQLKRQRDAYAWYYRAIAELPTMRDPYVEFAQAAYTLGDWSACLCMAETALSIKEKSKTYVNMGYAWDFTPHDLAAISSYHLGLYQRAIQHGQQALTHLPQDHRLQDNLTFYCNFPH